VNAERVDVLRRKLDAVSISAKNPRTLSPLIDRMSAMIEADPENN
jgi:hypothetical protein